MINVEICIDSTTQEAVRSSVEAAFLGGAATIELCGFMNLGGLTPDAEYIPTARISFRERAGLIVMIRPRGGDFFFDNSEIETMIDQIHAAAENGADGVAIGALRSLDNRIDTWALNSMLDACAVHGMSTTFHRAFDATPDPLESLDTLIDYGVARVMTSGLPWGNQGTALDGVANIASVVCRTRGAIEVVIGGGVSTAIVPGILTKIPLDICPLTLHAYSSVLVNGVTDVSAVKKLVDYAGLY